MDWETQGDIEENPIEEILKARGITDIEGFLNPRLKDLYKNIYDPFSMKDMAQGVNRMDRAIYAKEKVRVAGDYDADGVTSTALMVRGLEDLGAKVSYRIPLRSEGYALSNKIIDECKADGVTLIITVDNGITCVEQVAYAHSLGIDVIITDHHEPQEHIPNALAVINPKQESCGYITKELSGCGVAFKFLQALAEVRTGDMREMECYLDIVTIGTIADVMKLVGENRIIAKHGLNMMTDTDNRGIQQLIQVLGLDEQEEITAKHIGWNIAPCINAAGRLGDPAEAVEMFLTDSRREAHRIANSLKDINDERRKLTQEWAKKIFDVVDNVPELLNQKVMVIPFSDAVPEGLVGLIAGKLKERYSKPVILLVPEAPNSTQYFGSGRSIPAYNMFDELTLIKGLTNKFGGHAMACGLSLKRENIAQLSRILNDTAKLSDYDVKPKLFIDYEIDPEYITTKFAEEIKKMEPFGAGNNKPLFLLRDARAGDVKYLGKNKTHLKLRALVQEHSMDAIGFSMVDKWTAMGEPVDVDIAFYPSVNEWNGRRNVQLEIKDIREAQ